MDERTISDADLPLRRLIASAGETLGLVAGSGYINQDFEVNRPDRTWLLRVDSIAAREACEVMGFPLVGSSAGEFSSLTEVRSVIRVLTEIDPSINRILRSVYYSRDRWYRFQLSFPKAEKWYTMIAENHPLRYAGVFNIMGAYAPTRRLGPSRLEDLLDRSVRKPISPEGPPLYRRPAYAR